MENKIKKQIIKLYTDGKSSLEISKIVGLSKPTILKVLNKEGVVRKRDRCKSLTIYKIEEYFFVDRQCPLCKKTIQTKSKDKNIACRNHFNKIKMNCKTCSLLLQHGKGNPFYGKKHTDKTKQSISEKKIGKLKGINNPMSKKEWRDKAADKIREKWNNGEMEHVRKIFSEKLKETRRLGKIKSCNVSLKEKQIGKLLLDMGLEIIQSYQIDTKICDIYIPKFNLIIEYNGDYWHCNPKKYNEDYFNQKKSKTAKDIWEYDLRKLELIKSYGYNLEIVWESDLKSDPDIIKKIINKYDSKNNFAPERS